MKHKHESYRRDDCSSRSLQQAMKVLDALLEARTPLKLEEISALTELPKSTAYRITANLLQGQYLVETEEGYWLGLKMMRFGALVEENLDLKQQASPLLARLRDQLNETVHLGVLDHEMRVVYLEKLSGGHAIGLMASRVGITVPIHCTALGKMLAAFRPEHEIRDWIRSHGLKPYTEATITSEEAFFRELAELRLRGCAVDHAEYEPGVHCIAAPVRDRTGEVVAAISVSGPHTRMPEPLLGSSMAQRAVETAAEISRALGYFATPTTGERWDGTTTTSPSGSSRSVSCHLLNSSCHS
jgi:IclR family KDG regulon transcriptional repressor